jgi:hypothetical protein
MDVPADLDLQCSPMENSHIQKDKKTRAVRGDSTLDYSNHLKQMQFED